MTARIRRPRVPSRLLPEMNGRQIKRVLLASVLVAVALMGVGAYLIRKQASSQAGSPLGWFILVVGIAGVLSVTAFIAGAYTD